LKVGEKAVDVGFIEYIGILVIPTSKRLFSGFNLHL
jgi:hypothetical protein